MPIEIDYSFAEPKGMTIGDCVRRVAGAHPSSLRRLTFTNEEITKHDRLLMAAGVRPPQTTDGQMREAFEQTTLAEVHDYFGPDVKIPKDLLAQYFARLETQISEARTRISAVTSPNHQPHASL